MLPTLDCGAAMRQLWAFLDQELTPERMDAMRAHLASCKPCQSHSDFERAFLDAVARIRKERPVSSDLRARVMDALRKEGFIGSGIGNRQSEIDKPEGGNGKR